MNITLFSQFSILLPVLSGLLFYKKLSSPFKLLLAFYILSIGVEYLALWLSETYKNNMPLLHVFTAIEVSVYCYAFSSLFNGNRLFMLLCRAFIPIQLLISIADISLVNGIMRFPTLARTLGAVFLVFLSLYQLYILFNRTNDQYLFKKGRFWLLFGVLTYFSIIIFFLLLMNLTVNKDPETFQLIHDFHAGVNILCNFIFAYSFLCFRYRQD